MFEKMIFQLKVKKKQPSSMLRQHERGEQTRTHITVCADGEESNDHYGNCDDTPTKSENTEAEVCGLSLLQVKKSINFDLSRENSSDSFIVRDALEKKDLFFKVENLKFNGKSVLWINQ